MEIIASYPDFTFYKNPNYALRFGNQTLIFSEHFGIPEEEVKNIISSYETEHIFLKQFMNSPKLIKNNKIILGQIEEAKTPEQAKTGLLGRDNISLGFGLLIHNCSAIHMFGMKFPINTYFLDNQMKVCAKFENVSIGSYTPYIKDARYALETAVHPYDIKIGDQLDILKFDFIELE